MFTHAGWTGLGITVVDGPRPHALAPPRREPGAHQSVTCEKHQSEDCK